MSKDNPKEITAAPNDAKERAKAIETAMSQIEKAFGKGSIMKLGAESKLDIQVVSTGSLSLDLALGVGGIPRGRVTEIYGPESGGKTTLALAIAAALRTEQAMRDDLGKIEIEVPTAVNLFSASGKLGATLVNNLDQPVTVAGDGSQTRSVCFVDDLVAGILAFAAIDHPGPVNLGNPEEMSVLRIAPLSRSVRLPGRRSMASALDPSLTVRASLLTVR